MTETIEELRIIKQALLDQIKKKDEVIQSLKEKKGKHSHGKLAHENFFLSQEFRYLDPELYDWADGFYKNLKQNFSKQAQIKKEKNRKSFQTEKIKPEMPIVSKIPKEWNL